MIIPGELQGFSIVRSGDRLITRVSPVYFFILVNRKEILQDNGCRHSQTIRICHGDGDLSIELDGTAERPSRRYQVVIHQLHYKRMNGSISRSS